MPSNDIIAGVASGHASYKHMDDFNDAGYVK